MIPTEASDEGARHGGVPITHRSPVLVLFPHIEKSPVIHVKIPLLEFTVLLRHTIRT